MTYPSRWLLGPTLLALAALLAPVTRAEEKNAQRGPVAVGRVVSLDLKDDGTGTLTARVKRPARVPLRPTEMTFQVTKETRFLQGNGSDGEGTAVESSKVAGIFSKGVSVTVRYQREEGKLVATWPGLTVEAVASRTAIDAPVRLRLSVINGRPDHRLRLHVRLLEPAEGSWAMAPFEVVERPLRGEGGTETPSPTWPARQAALAGGVALFQEGVYEYEILPERSELAVTLLRCVGTISRPQLATRAWAAGPDIATPDAQMIGEQSFDLGVCSGLRPEQMPRSWERLFLPSGVAEATGGGDLPEAGSLLQIDGAELSAVRKVEGRTQVRIWNPSEERGTARVAGRQVEMGPAEIVDVEP